MAETTMAAAFRRAGGNPSESALRQIIYEALTKHHMNVERAVETVFHKMDGSLWDAALRLCVQQLADDMSGKGLPGDGHVVRDAQQRGATARQPIEDGGGHMPSADEGQRGLASPSSPDHGGTGQRPFDTHEAHASTDREPYRPGRSSRGLASITSIQPTLRQGLLYLIKTSDGRAWADVGWHELDGMDRDGAIARLIKRRVAIPMSKHAKLGDVLNEKLFQEIIDEAKQKNDLR